MIFTILQLFEFKNFELNLNRSCHVLGMTVITDGLSVTSCPSVASIIIKTLSLYELIRPVR